MNLGFHFLNCFEPRVIKGRTVPSRHRRVINAPSYCHFIWVGRGSWMEDTEYLLRRNLFSKFK